jgi:hypothetical protein
VLRGDPGERFAYLRLGMDELRVFAVALILIIIAFVVLFMGSMFSALIIGGLAMGGSPIGAAIGGFVVIFLMMAMIACFYIRFSLAVPLTLLRRRIVIGESWRLTSGRFWVLFLAYLAIFLIGTLLSVVTAAVTSGSYLMELIRGGMNPTVAQEAAQRQLDLQAGPIGPLMIVGWVVAAAVGTISLVMWGGAIATATRALVVDTDDYVETFA